MIILKKITFIVFMADPLKDEVLTRPYHWILLWNECCETALLKRNTFILGATLGEISGYCGKYRENGIHINGAGCPK